VVRYPAASLRPASRRDIRVGDGIVHVDHHFPRTALYSSIARFHVARNASPAQNVSRDLLHAGSASRPVSWRSWRRGSRWSLLVGAAGFEPTTPSPPVLSGRFPKSMILRVSAGRRS
jgi:hypothetical protein